MEILERYVCFITYRELERHYAKVMRTKDCPSKFDDLFCYWCGKPTPASSKKVLVCADCYKLLLKAGISEREIFQEDAVKSIN